MAPKSRSGSVHVQRIQDLTSAYLYILVLNEPVHIKVFLVVPWVVLVRMMGRHPLINILMFGFTITNPNQFQPHPEIYSLKEHRS